MAWQGGQQVSAWGTRVFGSLSHPGPASLCCSKVPESGFLAKALARPQKNEIGRFV
jgi:hypothetical protein